MLASTVVIAALQRALGDDQRSLFLLKGGVYLEMQLGAGARSTKDVDTMFRGQEAQLREALRDAFREPWGPFHIDYSDLEVIEGVQRPQGLKTYRCDVRLWLRGVIWRNVRVEMSFPEGRIAEETQPVPAPAIGFFGLEGPDHLAGIAMDYQVAQKLHAASDPDTPDYTNERVRDVVDLNLVRKTFYPHSPPSLKAACADLFSSRAVEAVELGLPPRRWPPLLVANETWRSLYPELSASVGLKLTLDEAIDVVHDWIAEIDASPNT
jgi:hypothetical protein